MSLPQTMKAAIATAYGGPEVVRIETRPVPVPRPDEVLIEVVATPVNSGDARIRALDAPAGMGPMMRLVTGWTRPRQPILGIEAAGRVVAVGANVTGFAVGDEVIAAPGFSMHCHAQYVAVNRKVAMVKKPAGLSFEEAVALCFGGTTALEFFRKAGLAKGEHVLVIGASGAVGTAMVQLARRAGARVTAATSAANAELMRELGADAVIDYHATDYTEAVAEYDVIADTVGASSFSRCLAALRPGGRYLAIAGGIPDMLARRKGDKRPISGMAVARPDDMALLADLAARGEYRAVIDQVVAFDDIAAAHARVDSRRKRGSVVVRVGD